MQKTKCASRVQMLSFAPYLRTWEGRKSQNQSGVLLSAHLACKLWTLLAKCASKVQAKCTLKSAPDRLVHTTLASDLTKPTLLTKKVKTTSKSPKHDDFVIQLILFVVFRCKFCDMSAQKWAVLNWLILFYYHMAAKMTRFWARFKQNRAQNLAIREILAKYYRIAPQNRAELAPSLFQNYY